MTPQELLFPEISSVQARLQNNICFDREDYVFQVEQHDVLVELRPLNGWSEKTDWVSVDLGTLSFEAGLPWNLLSHLLGAKFKGDETGVVCLFLQSLIRPYLEAGTIPIQHNCLDLSWSSPPELDLGCMFSLRISCNGYECEIPVFFDERHLPGAVSQLDNLMPRKTHGSVSFPLALVACRCTLTVRELVTLQVGDMIVVGPGKYPSSFELCQSEDFFAPATLRQKKIRLTGSFRRRRVQQIEEVNMSEESNNQLGHPDNVEFLDQDTLNDLPVRIDFSLCDVEVTLDQLSKIGKGYVFDLELPPSQTVKIRVGGRIIGYGEIVSLNAAYGVRVTRRN